MDLNFEEIQLLEYVYDQAAGVTRRKVNLPSSTPDATLVQDVSRQLKAAGLLEPASLGHDVYLTAAGREVADRLRRQRRDRPARAAAARNALLQWLYEHHADGTVPASTEEFLRSPEACHAGASFTAREVLQAAAYLARKGLIEGSTVEELPDLLQPQLTDVGLDCAEDGASVADFVAARVVSGTTFNVEITDSQNVAVGSQHAVTQRHSARPGPPGAGT